MSHVEQPASAAVEPARNPGRSKGQLQLLLRRAVGRRERGQHPVRYRGIPPLMRSRQAERATPFVVCRERPHVSRTAIVVTACPGTGPNSLTPQHLNQSRIGLADDEGHAGLGNPRLLAGNELETVAQVLHVVASDLGYSAHQRRTTLVL